MAAELIDSGRRMGGAPEERPGLEVELNIASLGTLSAQVLLPGYPTRRTSTSSRTVTTNTSRLEFLHPTTTPGRSDLWMFVGQNTLISPSCSIMSDGIRGYSRSHLEGTSSLKLLARRYAYSGGSWVLQGNGQLLHTGCMQGMYSYQVCLPPCQ